VAGEPLVANLSLSPDIPSWEGKGARAMQLVGFSIQNHARLEDCELEVRQHLVFVGANDVGKSSLLRCLDLALGTPTAQLYGRISSEDIRDPALPFVIEATLGHLTDEEQAVFPDEIHVDPTTKAKTLTIRLEVNADADGTIQILRTAPHGRTGRQVSRPQLQRLGWRMIGAVQSGARDFRQDRNSSLDDILSSIDLGEEQKAFETLTDLFQAQITDSAVLKQLRERLAGQLSRAIPEHIGTDDLSFVSGVSATNDVLTDVRLQVSRGGEPRNMTQQSDGTRALFAIALYDLVSESANIVAIDEPEIHLHPTSQRSLARLLQKGVNQKILATHSPDVVGSFPPEQIVSVRPGGGVVQPQAGFLTNEQRLLAHWWVRDKLEPLTAQRVILVEGASDRIVLQRIAELTDHELDRLGVSVIQLDGAGDVGPVLRLFGPQGFQVPLSFLIDKDAEAETAQKLGVPEADLGLHGVYVCAQDLEDEYVRAIGPGPMWTALTSSGLFSTNELANCVPTGSNGDRTQDDIAAFCRKRARGCKMRAGIVAAEALDRTTAVKITPVNDLLAAIVATAP
jgi:putative ATP-dependent endonuclease of the OLD family